MKSAVIILARGGSKGVPYKNLQQIGEHTLVAWAIRASAAAVGMVHVYVSTDCAEIAKEVRSVGATVIDRPAELATDTADATEAFLRAESCLDSSYDILLSVECTAFPQYSRDIARTIDTLIDEEADSATTVRRKTVFLWRNNLDGYAFPINQFDRRNRQESQPEYALTGAATAIRREVIQRTKQMLTGRIMLVETYEPQVDIDTLLDLKVAETIAVEMGLA